MIGKKDYKTKEFLKKYNSNFLEINDHKYDVQIKRYSYYREILKKIIIKNILLCDSRDIYFQADPFKYNYKGEINFSLKIKKLKIVSLIQIGF